MTKRLIGFYLYCINVMAVLAFSLNCTQAICQDRVASDVTPSPPDPFVAGATPKLSTTMQPGRINAYFDSASIAIAGRVEPLVHADVVIELRECWATSDNRVIGISTTVTEANKSQFGLTFLPPDGRWQSGDYRLEIYLNQMPQVREVYLLRLIDPKSPQPNVPFAGSTEVLSTMENTVTFDATLQGQDEPFRVSSRTQLLMSGSVPVTDADAELSSRSAFIEITSVNANMIMNSEIPIVLKDEDRFWFQKRSRFPRRDTPPGEYIVRTYLLKGGDRTVVAERNILVLPDTNVVK